MKKKKNSLCTNLRQKVIYNNLHFEKKKKRKAKISQIKKRLKTFGKLKTKFLHFKEILKIKKKIKMKKFLKS